MMKSGVGDTREESREDDLLRVESSSEKDGERDRLAEAEEAKLEGDSGC